MQDVLFVLAATDPEIIVAKRLLARHGGPMTQARLDSQRVDPANACDALLPAAALDPRPPGGRVCLAPAQRPTRIYVDPARGFAGACAD